MIVLDPSMIAKTASLTGGRVPCSPQRLPSGEPQWRGCTGYLSRARPQDLGATVLPWRRSRHTRNLGREAIARACADGNSARNVRTRPTYKDPPNLRAVVQMQMVRPADAPELCWRLIGSKGLRMKTTRAVIGYALLTFFLFLLGTVLGQLGAMVSSKALFPAGRHVAQAAPLSAAWFQVLILIGPALAITFLLAAFITYRERASVCGPIRGNAPDLVFGAGLGIAFWLCTIGLAYIDGGVRPGRMATGAAAAIPFITLLGWLPQAFSEEFVFRGWLLTRLRSRLNLNASVLVSAVIFAVAHGLNPDTTLIAYVNLFLAGLWFALMAIRTGGIAAPMMAHLAWNWLELSGFGLLAKGDEPQGGSLFNFNFASHSLFSGPGSGLNDSLALGISFAAFIVLELIIRKRALLASARSHQA